MTFILLLMFLQVTDGLPFSRPLESNRPLLKHMDIIDINQALGLDLFEGDIKIDQKNGRNSITGDQYRWPLTIPYHLENNLEVNAKAVILNAFERFRLKTCIDFKPLEGETNYISVIKDNGCYSSVGNQRKGKQILSVGSGCDKIEIVQHEFLHALGFWHEQSRSDRNDYVTIVVEQIESDNLHNFNLYDDEHTSFLNVPYDYTSIMHYDKNAFQIGSEPTIITKNPEFRDLIGQKMDFSERDIAKLNQLYNCTTSLSFLDSCTFELEDICGFLQSSDDDTDWERVTSVPAGPDSDHTYLENTKATGFFMHFGTATGIAGRKAILESRLFYPKRGFQCLEFFYYNSGHVSDRLEIWIKEYKTTSSDGTLKFINSVTGTPAKYWQLHHSSLNAATKFRVIFYGIKGTGSSSGGFSIDDINLSETECPQYVWHIHNFNHNSSREGIRSPPYYSTDGYAFEIYLWEYETATSPFNLAVYLQLISGANNNNLQWPCPWKQVTVELMDQNPNIIQRMSNAKSITTDPTKLSEDSSYYVWDNPEKIGYHGRFPNGTSYKIGPSEGKFFFNMKEWFYKREFLKGGDAFVHISMKDVSHLRDSPPTPNPELCTQNICQNDGICIIENQQPVCRCKVSGDFWYVGDRCENKVPNKTSDLKMSPFSALLVIITTFVLGSVA
ncbi:meprin A subunit beta-like [Spea bombifrons]|uniref:meprin A subunit beta-like n=1 Tax=Spea bombifrons TaxID=233779 RepID=UPI00234A28FD|nr:meprin A subunit beta-like [Spea bombifrons]